MKRFAFRRACMPTSTFSSAVMFWKRRMFWNVRPMPRAVIACGGLPVTSSPRNVIVPGGRLVDAGEHVEERRLAGAVRADQRDDLAARHGEVDVVDGDEAAELLADAARDEDVVVRRRRASRSSRCDASYSGSSCTPSCSSAARRLDGISPSGRKSMTITMITP